MATVKSELHYAQIVRLTRDLESPNGILPKGTTLVVTEVNADMILAHNGYGEYNLPPQAVEPL